MLHFNHRNSIISFAAILSLTIFGIFSLSKAQSFDIDLLNIESLHPERVAAYFTPDKLRLKEAWGLLNGNSTLILRPVNIGIIDRAVDGAGDHERATPKQRGDDHAGRDSTRV
jgi:hypothetical protein